MFDINIISRVIKHFSDQLLFSSVFSFSINKCTMYRNISIHLYHLYYCQWESFCFILSQLFSLLNEPLIVYLYFEKKRSFLIDTLHVTFMS